MLDGKRIAILVAEGFAGLELAEAIRAMKTANARVIIVGDGGGESYRSSDDRKLLTAEMHAEQAMAEVFDAVIIAGTGSGQNNPGSLAVAALVSRVHRSGGIVAAISGGQQLLLAANIAGGRRLTSLPPLAAALRHAGADWVDEPVVRDGNIITARKPADIPMFNKAIIEAVATAGSISAANLQREGTIPVRNAL